MTARHSAAMAWMAAGCPRLPNALVVAGRCWWCASNLSRGVPVASMPSTFLDACGRDASNPSAAHLCEPCAWTLSDAVRLPREVGGPLLARALAGDGEHPGRVAVAVGDEAPTRRLVLRLASGHVGVWERSGRPQEEVGWVRVRGSMVGTPSSVPGCAYLGAFDEAALATRVGGKFRNFIVYADTVGRWRMWTKADRRDVRAVLLSPPDRCGWTLAIGDGQKHAAIYAPVNVAGTSVAMVHFEGSTVTYRPRDLCGLVNAVEALLAAGAHRTCIESGRYAPRTGAELSVLRAQEPTVARWRGSALFGVAMWVAERGVTGLPDDGEDT